MNLKVGDKVKVLTGDDKGNFGKILSISRDSKNLLVEGINVKTKHIKPVTKDKSGEIIQKEAPIDISNVMLCDSDGFSSRVRIVRNGKNRDRFSKKTGKKFL